MDRSRDCRYKWRLSSRSRPVSNSPEPEMPMALPWLVSWFPDYPYVRYLRLWTSSHLPRVHCLSEIDSHRRRPDTGRCETKSSGGRKGTAASRIGAGAAGPAALLLLSASLVSAAQGWILLAMDKHGVASSYSTPVCRGAQAAGVAAPVAGVPALVPGWQGDRIWTAMSF